MTDTQTPNINLDALEAASTAAKKAIMDAGIMPIRDLKPEVNEELTKCVNALYDFCTGHDIPMNLLVIRQTKPGEPDEDGNIANVDELALATCSSIENISGRFIVLRECVEYLFGENWQPDGMEALMFMRAMDGLIAKRNIGLGKKRLEDKGELQPLIKAIEDYYEAEQKIEKAENDGGHEEPTLGR